MFKGSVQFCFWTRLYNYWFRHLRDFQGGAIVSSVCIAVIRWVPSFSGVSMIGPPHLQRAHQQCLLSQMCLLCSQPLCTTDATLGAEWSLSSSTRGISLPVQLHLRGIDGLGLASNSQFFKPLCSFTHKAFADSFHWADLGFYCLLSNLSMITAVM